MYIYKTTINYWKLLSNTLVKPIIIPSGSCFLTEESAFAISITNIATKEVYFDKVDVREITRENNTPYASISEFLTECGDFFVNATRLLEVRVAELEESQTLFIDYKGNVEPLSPTSEFVWYEDATNTLWIFINEEWLNTPLSTNSVYVDRATNQQYSWSGTTLVPMTVPLTKPAIESLIYSPKLTLPALAIDLAVAEVFEKALTGATQFTISNPINFKSFRLILTGGSLIEPIFNGYTVTWAASTSIADYVAGNSNILYCEVRGANLATVFWGE